MLPLLLFSSCMEAMLVWLRVVNWIWLFCATWETENDFRVSGKGLWAW